MSFSRTSCLLLLLAIALAGCDTPAESDANAAPNPSRMARPAKTPTVEPPPPKKDPYEDRVTVFDFVDNRHLAHFWDGGLVLDLGHASATKYVQGRWNSGWYDAVEAEDGVFHGQPRGVQGTVRFPVYLPVDAEKKGERWEVAVRLKPAGFQRCDLFLAEVDREERKFASLNEIDDGWKTYRVPLPADLEVGQEHSLRLHFSRSRSVPGGRRTGATIDWVRVGPAEAKEPDRIAEKFRVPEREMQLDDGEALTWHFVPADGAVFRSELEGDVELVVSADGGESRTFQPADGWLTADLSTWRDTPVRFTLRGKGEGGTLRNAVLRTTAGEVLERVDGPKYVVVWIIDTLRADHLKLYNPKTDVKTPNLDAFANEAVVFTNATVQGNSSLPTSASIFTGAYTVRHELTTESARLDPDHPLLGQPFAQAGWATGLFSSNGYVHNSRGFDRGFEKEVNPIRESRPSDTEYLWPEARDWLKTQLEADGDGPALLYVNTVDPHVPYDPPKEQLAHYYQGPRVGKVSPRGTGQLLHDIAAGKVDLNAREKAYMHALYKGEITYNDLWFGKMLEDLEELGIRDETMIVVTSDHGEEFGEYGRFGHGVSVNEELVGVPLIVGYRPWTKGGHRSPQAAEVIDIYPTIADATGVGFDADRVQGRSLVDLLLNRTPRHPTAGFAYHNDFLRSARVGDWKYQLFNGDNDPLFQIDYTRAGAIDRGDVGPGHPIARRMMRDLMAFQVGFDSQWSKSRHGYVNNQNAQIADALDRDGW